MSNQAMPDNVHLPLNLAIHELINGHKGATGATINSKNERTNELKL